jgi:hypothetical protein
MLAETEAQPSAADLDELLVLQDERFLRAAYRLFLGREADPEGFHAYLEQLRGGVARLEVVALLALSREGLAHAARSPRARAAFSEATRVIRSRLAPEADTIEALLAHDDEAFVRCAYLVVLARDPDAAGLALYVGLLRGGEPKRRVLGSLRRSAEGVACDARRLAVRTALARSGSEAADLRALLALAPIAMLAHAYALLTGRRASAQELALQVNRLVEGVAPVRILADLAQSEAARLHMRLAADVDRLLRHERWVRLPVVGNWAAMLLGLESDSRTERRWRRLENQIARLAALLQPGAPTEPRHHAALDVIAAEEAAPARADEVLLRVSPSVTARLTSLPPANDEDDRRAHP